MPMTPETEKTGQDTGKCVPSSPSLSKRLYYPHHPPPCLSPSLPFTFHFPFHHPLLKFQGPFSVLSPCPVPGYWLLTMGWMDGGLEGQVRSHTQISEAVDGTLVNHALGVLRPSRPHLQAAA